MGEQVSSCGCGGYDNGCGVGVNNGCGNCGGCGGCGNGVGNGGNCKTIYARCAKDILKSKKR